MAKGATASPLLVFAIAAILKFLTPTEAAPGGGWRGQWASEAGDTGLYEFSAPNDAPATLLAKGTDGVLEVLAMIPGWDRVDPRYGPRIVEMYSLMSNGRVPIAVLRKILQGTA